MRTAVKVSLFVFIATVLALFQSTIFTFAMESDTVTIGTLNSTTVTNSGNGTSTNEQCNENDTYFAPIISLINVTPDPLREVYPAEITGGQGGMANGESRERASDNDADKVYDKFNIPVQVESIDSDVSGHVTVSVQATVGSHFELSSPSAGVYFRACEASSTDVQFMNGDMEMPSVYGEIMASGNHTLTCEIIVYGQDESVESREIQIVAHVESPAPTIPNCTNTVSNMKDVKMVVGKIAKRPDIFVQPGDVDDPSKHSFSMTTHYKNVYLPAYQLPIDTLSNMDVGDHSLGKTLLHGANDPDVSLRQKNDMELKATAIGQRSSTPGVMTCTPAKVFYRWSETVNGEIIEKKVPFGPVGFTKANVVAHQTILLPRANHSQYIEVFPKQAAMIDYFITMTKQHEEFHAKYHTEYLEEKKEYVQGGEFLNDLKKYLTEHNNYNGSTYTLSVPLPTYIFTPASEWCSLQLTITAYDVYMERLGSEEDAFIPETKKLKPMLTIPGTTILPIAGSISVDTLKGRQEWKHQNLDLPRIRTCFLMREADPPSTDPVVMNGCTLSSMNASSLYWYYIIRRGGEKENSSVGETERLFNNRIIYTREE